MYYKNMSFNSPQVFPTDILTFVSRVMFIAWPQHSRHSFTTLAAFSTWSSLTCQTISSWIIITRTLSTPSLARFSSDFSRPVLAMSAAEPWMRKLGEKIMWNVKLRTAGESLT